MGSEDHGSLLLFLFCTVRRVGQFDDVDIENGIDRSTIDGLRLMGHCVRGPVEGHSRAMFGWGQAITRGAWWKAADNDAIADDPSILWVGVDPRCDGQSVVF